MKLNEEKEMNVIDKLLSQIEFNNKVLTSLNQKNNKIILFDFYSEYIHNLDKFEASVIDKIGFKLDKIDNCCVIRIHISDIKSYMRRKKIDKFI